jgi:hypothetical protein
MPQLNKFIFDIHSFIDLPNEIELSSNKDIQRTFKNFAYEFFLQIAQSFPFLVELTIINEKPQHTKRSRTSKHDNQNLSIIEYSHLTDSVLYKAHDDYIEQFLLDIKTYLPDDLDVFVTYPSLK